MSDVDPYLSQEVDADVQIVFAARPIVLTQDQTAGEDVVPVMSDRDLVVFADEVTIRGALAFHRPQAPDGTGGAGSRVQILARKVDSIPGATSDAGLDVAGGAGITSTKVWVAAAKTGPPVAPGHSIWHPIKDDTAIGDRGSPGTPGSAGDPGGTGGAGGGIDIRCSFAATTAAISLVADGGPGGNGLDGQVGGQGGQGGPGADGENYWAGPTPSAATEGGPGGLGGAGGNGGAPGAGGTPGSIRLRARNAGMSAFGSSLQSGLPGDPGAGAARGLSGSGGQGGVAWVEQHAPGGGLGSSWVKGGRVASGTTPDQPKDKGKTPDKLSQGAPGAPDAKDQCDDTDLVSGLVRPIATYTAMLLDRIQVDFLAVSGSDVADDYADLADRIDWLCALLDAYSPAAPGELGQIASQRTAAKLAKDRLTATVDYYGHCPDWVPLGSIEYYGTQFAAALQTLQDVEADSDRHVTALIASTQSVSELKDAKNALVAGQAAYNDAAKTEHKNLTRLIASVATKNGEATDARTQLDGTVAAFEQAVNAATGLTAGDFLDVVSQFAFFGQETFQQLAMVGGEALKLGDAMVNKVVDVDGQHVDKGLVVDRLTAVPFTVDELQQISGGAAGVDLADPAALKLVAQQEQFDAICEKFWNIPGASDAKAAFDAYVSAVQARNADIVSLNESLDRLRDWVAGAEQTRAAIAAADAKAATGVPGGASAIVAQLQRMLARARADCISNLYLASRAHAFWSLVPGDALASVLSDLATGRPLAMTSTALDAAGEQILSKYGGEIDAGLKNRPITFPAPQAGTGSGGIIVRFTEESHPTVFEELRAKGHTTVILHPSRKRTTADENPFAGHLDVRLTMAHCWVHGVRWAPGTGSGVRVDFEHEGRETVVTIDDDVVVVRHDPVHVMTKYDSRRPGDPAGLIEVSDLQDGSAKPVGALIGPFARWRIVVDPALNVGVDLSKVTEITFEFHGSAVWKLS